MPCPYKSQTIPGPFGTAFLAFRTILLSGAAYYSFIVTMVARFLSRCLAAFLAPCLIVDPAFPAARERVAMAQPTGNARLAIWNELALAVGAVNFVPGPILGPRSKLVPLAYLRLRMKERHALNDEGLTHEEIKIREAARRFVQKKVAPIAAELDRTNEIELLIRNNLLLEMSLPLGNGHPSLVAAAFPKAYGGYGLGAMVESIITEELGKGSQAVALIHDVRTALTAAPILMALEAAIKEGRQDTVDLLKEILPGLLDGRYYAGYGQSESKRPASDVPHLETTATEVDDGFIIDGDKYYNTLGMIADCYIVFARDPGTIDHHGLGAFLVPRNAPGLTVTHMTGMSGHRGTGTAALVFNNVKIPKSHMLLPYGQGYGLAKNTLNRGRVSITSIIQASLEITVDEVSREYAERLQKGMSQEDQAEWEAALTDMMADAYAARRLLLNSARKREEEESLGVTDKSDNLSPAVAKLIAAEMADRNAVRAMKLIGPESLRVGSRPERNFRDTGLLRIGEGTTEVMRHVVLRALTKDGKLGLQDAIWNNCPPAMIDPVRDPVVRLLKMHEDVRDEIARGRIERRVIDLLAEGLALSLMGDSRSRLAKNLQRASQERVRRLGDQFFHESQAIVQELNERNGGRTPDDLRRVESVNELLSDDEGRLIDKTIQGIISENIPKPSDRKGQYGTVIPALIRKLGEAGLLGAGLELAPGEEAAHEPRAPKVVMKAAAKVDLSAASAILEQEKAAAVLRQFDAPAARPILLGLKSGEQIGAVAWRDGEPPTKAEVSDGGSGDYRLSGRKNLVINGGHADVFIVIAETSPGERSAFVVRKGDGVKVIDGQTLGLRGAFIRDVEFSQAPAILLGRVGQGEEVLRAAQAVEDSLLPAVQLAAGISMVEQGESYARDRKLKVPSAGPGSPLTDLAIITKPRTREQLEDTIDTVLSLPNLTAEEGWELLTARAKDIQQVHGGSGYDSDSQIEHYWRDVPTWWILYGRPKPVAPPDAVQDPVSNFTLEAAGPRDFPLRTLTLNPDEFSKIATSGPEERRALASPLIARIRNRVLGDGRQYLLRNEEAIILSDEGIRDLWDGAEIIAPKGKEWAKTEYLVRRTASGEIEFVQRPGRLTVYRFKFSSASHSLERTGAAGESLEETVRGQQVQNLIERSYRSVQWANEEGTLPDTFTVEVRDEHGYDEEADLLGSDQDHTLILHAGIFGYGQAAQYERVRGGVNHLMQRDEHLRPTEPLTDETGYQQGFLGLVQDVRVLALADAQPTSRTTEFDRCLAIVADHWRNLHGHLAPYIQRSLSHQLLSPETLFGGKSALDFIFGGLFESMKRRGELPNKHVRHPLYPDQQVERLAHHARLDPVAPSPAVKREFINGTAWITLNQSVLTDTFLDDLEKAVAGLADNDNVNSVVITGTGKAFLMGADLNERLKMSHPKTREFLSRMNRVFDQVADLSKKKTTIALLNGPAYGGGVELALACGYRIAVENGLYALPEVQLGIIPGASGTQRLSRLIDLPGQADKSVPIVLTPREISGKEAKKIGLVDLAVAPTVEAMLKAVEELKKNKPRAPAPAVPAIEDMAQEIALTARELQFIKAFLSDDKQTDHAQQGYRKYLQDNHRVDGSLFQSLQGLAETHLTDRPEGLLELVATHLPIPSLRPSEADHESVMARALEIFQALSSPQNVQTRVDVLRTESQNYAPWALAAAEVAVKEGAKLTLERGQRLERLCYELTLISPERDEALRNWKTETMVTFDGLRAWLGQALQPYKWGDAYQEVHDRAVAFARRARLDKNLNMFALAERLREHPPIMNDTTYRDGFQSLPYFGYRSSLRQTNQKKDFIQRGTRIAGSRNRVEVAAMADVKRIAKWINALRKTSDIFPEVSYVISKKGGAKEILDNDPEAAEIAINVSASPAYNAKTTQEKDPVKYFREQLAPELAYVQKWASKARSQGPAVRLRGYISCVWGYLPQVEKEVVSIDSLVKMIIEMHKSGVTEFVLCDTVGRAAPDEIMPRLAGLLDRPEIRKLAGVTFAVRFHDSGDGLLNTLIALQDKRIEVVDTALANIGGSTFANVNPNENLSPGNVSLPDLEFAMEALGAATGINLGEALESERQLEAMIREDLLAEGSKRRLFGLHRLIPRQLEDLFGEFQVALLKPDPVTVKVQLTPEARGLIGKGRMRDSMQVESSNPTVEGVLEAMNIAKVWHPQLSITVKGLPVSLTSPVENGWILHVDVLKPAASTDAPGAKAGVPGRPVPPARQIRTSA